MKVNKDIAWRNFFWMMELFCILIMMVIAHMYVWCITLMVSDSL